MIITSQIIQELKQNITPGQVIEYYTGQRPTHNKYLCPFHNDKHPSLSVKGDYWRCWSCGSSGDIIDFVRNLYNIDFRDAVAMLCNDFGIAVEHDPVKVDRDQIMWGQIAREADQANRQQLREYFNNEIDTLTAAHRILTRYDAPKEVLDVIANDIDYLMNEAR